MLMTPAMQIQLHDSGAVAAHIPRLEAYVAARHAADLPVPLSRHPRWLTVLERGLRHVPYCLEAVSGGETRGLLPLAHVQSMLFGSFLVSLPYLNYGGALADDAETAMRLVNEAIALAERLNVRYLEIRDDQWTHPGLVAGVTGKQHMRLELPDTPEELWDKLPPKVRNQVRKGRNHELDVNWGGNELLGDFYRVFSRNMRDLGTPVYGRGLFRETLRAFPDRAEICVVRAGREPVAAALLLHGWGTTEVPSASSLRAYNHTCANMLMYWQLLERAVQRFQAVFDFGRSTVDSSTFRFKKQWGAEPVPAAWHHFVRHGGPSEMRPDNPRYQRRIQIWRKLPVFLTRWIGPSIVRGIP